MIRQGKNRWRLVVISGAALVLIGVLMSIGIFIYLDYRARYSGQGSIQYRVRVLGWTLDRWWDWNGRYPDEAEFVRQEWVEDFLRYCGREEILVTYRSGERGQLYSLIVSPYDTENKAMSSDAHEVIVLLRKPTGFFRAFIRNDRVLPVTREDQVSWNIVGLYTPRTMPASRPGDGS